MLDGLTSRVNLNVDIGTVIAIPSCCGVTMRVACEALPDGEMVCLSMPVDVTDPLFSMDADHPVVTLGWKTQ